MELHRVLSFLAFALVAFPSLVVGQGAGIVRGRVTDATTSEPLAGVMVRVEGTTVGAQTAADGTYAIVGVPPGAQAVTTRRLGYAPQRQTVTVPDAGSAAQDFALGRVATALNEVVVTALGQSTTARGASGSSSSGGSPSGASPV